MAGIVTAENRNAMDSPAETGGLRECCSRGWSNRGTPNFESPRKERERNDGHWNRRADRESDLQHEIK